MRREEEGECYAAENVFHLPLRDVDRIVSSFWPNAGGHASRRGRHRPDGGASPGGSTVAVASVPIRMTRATSSDCRRVSVFSNTALTRLRAVSYEIPQDRAALSSLWPAARQFASRASAHESRKALLSWRREIYAARVEHHDHRARGVKEQGGAAMQVERPQNQRPGIVPRDDHLLFAAGMRVAFIQRPLDQFHQCAIGGRVVRDEAPLADSELGADAICRRIVQSYDLAATVDQDGGAAQLLKDIAESSRTVGDRREHG